MTQEELDALMSGDIGDIDGLEDDGAEEMASADESQEASPQDNASEDEDGTPEGYSDETSHHWPLPATDENKMVHQLDDVTKESEEKASEIFDIIEEISNDLMEKEESLNNILEVLNANVELFYNSLSKVSRC